MNKPIIYIFVDKPTKCNGEYSVYFQFKYNIDIINTIKNQPIRYYNPNDRSWEIPIKAYNNVIKDLKKLNVEFNILEESKQLLDNQLSIEKEKKLVHVPNNYIFKTKPYKHQLDGIEYGLQCDKFLLGDEQGLGKTMQVINIACIKKEQRRYKHCLIICGVNGLKWNWKSEVEKHSNEKAYILGTRYQKGREIIGTVSDRLDDLKNINRINDYFLITNIETLRNEQIIGELKLLCDNNIINMIALDEGHKCKDPTSIQGKAILKLQAETLISMTGTPLMNNPLDLYIHLKWLGYEQHNYYAFKQHYCVFGGFGGYQVVGYRHLDQLKEQFDELVLRRLKKDVLDLPDKIYTTEYVEMNNKQTKIYNEVLSEIKENIDKVSEAINPLAEMIRLRQATGYTGILSSTIQESAKLDRLDELLSELVANNKKAIIFSNWTTITDTLYKRYAKEYNPAIITGNTKDRVAEQNKFMTDSSCRLIIGTTGAMGTGLTLTAATTVIFLDEPWNRALREQAEDRAHRIGTTENVNIIFLITKDTIDERIHELVEQKGKLSDLLIDGKMTKQNKAKLINFLLS